MGSIFSDKSRLAKEYQRQFLEKLSDPDKLVACIKSRYDKPVSPVVLKRILSNIHIEIFNFVGSQNEHRIRYFFDDITRPISRNDQIKVADRFILDCIHFEILGNFIYQLKRDFSLHHQEIKNTWHEELNAYSDLGPIDPELLITKILNTNKNNFFDDLIFPDDNRNVDLFIFTDNKLKPNPYVFQNWLPKATNQETKKTLLIIGAALVASLTLSPALFFSFKGFGFTAGLSLAGPIGLTIAGLLAVASLCLATRYIYLSVMSNNETKKAVANDIPSKLQLRPSHTLMNEKMPRQHPTMETESSGELTRQSTAQKQDEPLSIHVGMVRY